MAPSLESVETASPRIATQLHPKYQLASYHQRKSKQNFGQKLFQAVFIRKTAMFIGLHSLNLPTAVVATLDSM